MAAQTKWEELAQNGCGVFYFYSTEPYLVRRQVRRACALLAAGQQEDGEEPTVLDGPAPDVEQVMMAAGTISFFGTRRVVCLPELDPAAYGEKDLEALTDTLISLENAVAVLGSVFEADRSGKARPGKRAQRLIDACRKLGWAEELAKPGPVQLRQMLADRAAAQPGELHHEQQRPHGEERVLGRAQPEHHDERVQREVRDAADQKRQGRPRALEPDERPRGGPRDDDPLHERVDGDRGVPAAEERVGSLQDRGHKQRVQHALLRVEAPGLEPGVERPRVVAEEPRPRRQPDHEPAERHDGDPRHEDALPEQAVPLADGAGHDRRDPAVKKPEEQRQQDGGDGRHAEHRAPRERGAPVDGVVHVELRPAHRKEAHQQGEKNGGDGGGVATRLPSPGGSVAQRPSGAPRVLSKVSCHVTS